MAEEVRNVERTLPLAILISVAITFVLYLGVFALVNLSLVVLRLREGSIPWLPGIAAAGCVAMLILRLVAL